MKDRELREAVSRVEEMERCFDAVRGAAAAPERWADGALGEALKRLRDYYTGGQWLRDYELDEAGMLPPQLKRGVLAQDALHHVLEELRQKGILPRERRRIVLLSFDDGTVWDRWFVEMLDHYGLPCTFNLNSGLEDFVWECEGMPVHRLRLREHKGIYAGHEVAGHTLSHPCLTSLTEQELLWEVGEDGRVIRRLFGLEEIGFAVPFTQCGEREIDLLRRSGLVSYIRLSELKDGFEPPRDPFHIYVSGLYNEAGIWEKVEAFAHSDLPLSVFVLCGHSYEFEVNGEWEHMESVLQALKAIPGVEFMTTMEFVKTFY